MQLLSKTTPGTQKHDSQAIHCDDEASTGWQQANESKRGQKIGKKLAQQPIWQGASGHEQVWIERIHWEIRSRCVGGCGDIVQVCNTLRVTGGETGNIKDLEGQTGSWFAGKNGQKKITLRPSWRHDSQGSGINVMLSPVAARNSRMAEVCPNFSFIQPWKNKSFKIRSFTKCKYFIAVMPRLIWQHKLHICWELIL